MSPLIAPTGIGERSFPIRRADTTASPSCIDTASLSPCLLRRRAVPSSSRRGPWAQQAIEGLPPPRASKGSKFKDLIPTPRGIEHKDYGARQNQLQENNSLTVNFFDLTPPRLNPVLARMPERWYPNIAPLTSAADSRKLEHGDQDETAREDDHGPKGTKAGRDKARGGYVGHLVRSAGRMG